MWRSEVGVRTISGSSSPGLTPEGTTGRPDVQHHRGHRWPLALMQPLAHPSERVNLATLLVGSRWRHIGVSDVAKKTDIYKDADQDLTA